MTAAQAADFLRSHDRYLILTHKRPDGDTLGCAAGLCAILRSIGKTAFVLENAEATEHFLPYIAPYLAPADYTPDTVVSVDLAAASLVPTNAKEYFTRVDLAFDHHPSYEQFAAADCVMPECAACAEILCAVAQELNVLTAEVALPLYVALSTDTGCFVYSNTTANTHRVAAALFATGMDFRTVNKLHFRTKSRKRLALEARLIREMKFHDGGRIAVVRLPLALREELQLSESDAEDIAALGGSVEGVDCSITMRETPDGWKISLRTGERVNATLACSYLGGGGHRAASGCMISGADGDEAERRMLEAIDRAIEEESRG